MRLRLLGRNTPFVSTSVVHKARLRQGHWCVCSQRQSIKMKARYLGLFFLALLVSAEAISLRERINTVLFQKHTSRVQDIVSRAMERVENGENIDSSLSQLESIGHGLSDQMIQTLEIHAVHRLASTMDLPVFAELGPVPPRVLSGKEI